MGYNLIGNYSQEMVYFSYLTWFYLKSVLKKKKKKNHFSQAEWGVDSYIICEKVKMAL